MPLEYNNRVFEEDLEALIAWSIQEQMKGRTFFEAKSATHRPWFPYLDLIHKFIDVQEGCPNMPPAEAEEHVAKRGVWARALFNALQKQFP